MKPVFSDRTVHRHVALFLFFNLPKTVCLYQFKIQGLSIRKEKQTKSMQDAETTNPDVPWCAPRDSICVSPERSPQWEHRLCRSGCRWPTGVRTTWAGRAPDHYDPAGRPPPSLHTWRHRHQERCFRRWSLDFNILSPKQGHKRTAPTKTANINKNKFVILYPPPPPKPIMCLVSLLVHNYLFCTLFWNNAPGYKAWITNCLEVHMMTGSKVSCNHENPSCVHDTSSFFFWKKEKKTNMFHNNQPGSNTEEIHFNHKKFRK